MNNKSDFKNFFPTDNSSGTNMRYDLVASKFMVGISNYQKASIRRHTSTVSVIIDLIIAVLQLLVFLILIVFNGLQLLFNYINKSK